MTMSGMQFDDRQTDQLVRRLWSIRQDLRRVNAQIDHVLKESVEQKWDPCLQIKLIGEILTLESRRQKLRRENDAAMWVLRQAFYADSLRHGGRAEETRQNAFSAASGRLQIGFRRTS